LGDLSRLPSGLWSWPSLKKLLEHLTLKRKKKKKKSESEGNRREKEKTNRGRSSFDPQG
jgi:hypothetical protein